MKIPRLEHFGADDQVGRAGIWGTKRAARPRAAADSFGSLTLDRRGALRQALAVEPPRHDLSLLDSLR